MKMMAKTVIIRNKTVVTATSFHADLMTGVPIRRALSHGSGER